jgi:ABC-type branched-subunit amino acid transport system ATPase component
MPILAVRGIVKRFGGLPAVDGVGLDVDAGETLAVIGPNGAGKSTLLGMLSGLVRPTRVEVLRLGATDLLGMRPHAVRRVGVATVTQTPRVFRSMSVVDDVAVGAWFGSPGAVVGRAEARARADHLVERLGLADRRVDPASTLSLHEQRLLALARALAGRPRLLLLDEVMAGLNPTELDAFVQVLQDVRAELDLAVIVVEHVMRAVRALADRVLVLDHGRELAQGYPEDVMRDPAVVEAYLGRRGGAHARG